MTTCIGPTRILQQSLDAVHCASDRRRESNAEEIAFRRDEQRFVAHLRNVVAGVEGERRDSRSQRVSRPRTTARTGGEDNETPLKCACRRIVIDNPQNARTHGSQPRPRAPSPRLRSAGVVPAWSRGMLPSGCRRNNRPPGTVPLAIRYNLPSGPNRAPPTSGDAGSAVWNSTARSASLPAELAIARQSNHWILGGFAVCSTKTNCVRAKSGSNAIDKRGLREPRRRLPAGERVR